MRPSVCAVSVRLASGAGNAVFGQARSTPDRHVGRDERVTIASQLRPSDRYVILDYNGTPPLIVNGPPRDKSQLEWLADNSEVIVVIHVEGIESSWVNRDVTFTERQVSG